MAGVGQNILAGRGRRLQTKHTPTQNKLPPERGDVCGCDMCAHFWRTMWCFEVIQKSCTALQMGIVTAAQQAVRELRFPS